MHFVHQGLVCHSIIAAEVSDMFVWCPILKMLAVAEQRKKTSAARTKR